MPSELNKLRRLPKHILPFAIFQYKEGIDKCLKEIKKLERYIEFANKEYNKRG